MIALRLTQINQPPATLDSLVDILKCDAPTQVRQFVTFCAKMSKSNDFNGKQATPILGGQVQKFLRSFGKVVGRL
eukprot:UN31840